MTRSGILSWLPWHCILGACWVIFNLMGKWCRSVVLPVHQLLVWTSGSLWLDRRKSGSSHLVPAHMCSFWPVFNEKHSKDWKVATLNISPSKIVMRWNENENIFLGIKYVMERPMKSATGNESHKKTKEPLYELLWLNVNICNIWVSLIVPLWVCWRLTKPVIQCINWLINVLVFIFNVKCKSL